jgi:hypothetical protein
VNADETTFGVETHAAPTVVVDLWALKATVTVDGLEGYPLAAYLVHVVMHGIETLSGAAVLLHRAGGAMGDAGYLDFVDAVGTGG